MMILATIGAREESTHVATAQPAVKLTYEDYCAAPADERYELLDGATSSSTEGSESSCTPPATYCCPTTTSCSRTCCSSPGNGSTC